MPRILLVLILLAMTIYSLIDCARTDESAMPARIKKPIWIAAIIIVPILGPALWLIFKTQKMLKTDSGFGTANIPGKLRKHGNSEPSGPLAPDDDPDFLSRLEAQNRRRQYEQKKRKSTPNKQSARNSILTMTKNRKVYIVRMAISLN
ncbi:PLD nuclease N-terminal domain-containing protein [Arcanobacterium hippocoleae]